MTATVNSTVVLIHIQFDAKNVFNAAQCRVQCVPFLVVKKKKNGSWNNHNLYGLTEKHNRTLQGTVNWRK